MVGAMHPCRLVILGLACVWLAGCQEDVESGSAPPQPVRAVRATAVQYRPSAAITGEVRAKVQSDLSFRTGGRVTERLVDVGSRVRTGDVLARIDDAEQRAEVEIARAGVQSAEATVKQKTLAFDRNKALLQSRNVAQATYDQSQMELIAARSALETADATLATALDSLSYAELKADADGIITSRSIEVGEVVSAAQPALTLAHDGPRDAVFDVFEAFFLAGPLSDEVAVTSVAGGTGSLRGEIREVSPAIDTSSGTIRVKVALPEDALWPLGAAVAGEFRLPARSGIVLPWSAMTSAKGEPAIWTVDAATGAVSLRTVTVDRYRTADFIVTGGVAAQDRVVVEGGKFLREGQAVTWEDK